MLPSNTNLLPDKYKVSLTHLDLFDRVINLRLTTADFKNENGTGTKKDVFYIRSDYEVVFPDLDVTKVMRTGNISNSRYFIRKCQMKPSVRVEYTKVSSSVSTEIDIYVSNFYLMDSSGKKLMSFSNEYPLASVDIMLGYWGQFKNLPHATVALLNSQFDIAKKTPLFGIQCISVDCKMVTTEKMPPDYTLHIHGWVGSNPTLGAVGDIQTADYLKIIASGELENVSQSSVLGSALSDIFFNHITRRFPKHNVVDALASKGVNGRFTKAQAKMYGIQVYLSKGAQQVSKKRIEKKMKDSTGAEVPVKLYFANGDTAHNTMLCIFEAVNADLQYTTTIDGDFIVFTEEEAEKIEDLKKAFQETGSAYLLENNVDLFYNKQLPAIYNINIDNAMAQISAPFFYFIECFDNVKFANSFANTGLVAYFSSFGTSVSDYFLIQQRVSFATVDDVNEMILVCVAKKDSGV